MISADILVKIAADVTSLKSGMEEAQGATSKAAKAIEGSIGIMKTALIGLAGIGSIAAFESMVRGNIEAAAAMGKLATQAGTTTEAMSGLAAVGKLSGTSADTVAGAMNKMTMSMSKASEDGAGAASALRAIGLSFDDFQKMSPDERMMATAKAMANFQDGAGKSGVAMALMGRAGAEMLPYMKDLAEVGELQAKVTAEQSAQARDFEQNLRKVTATQDAWKKQISMAMLPALDEASKAFLGVMNGAGGVREEVGKLSKDGSITEWTRNSITGLTYLADAAEYVWRMFKATGMAIGGFAAELAAGFGGIGEAFDKLKNGDFKGAYESLASGARMADEANKQSSEDIAKMWGEDTMGAKFRARMEELKGIGTAAAKGLGTIDANFNQKGGDQAKNNAELEKQAALIATLAGLTPAFQKDWDMLTAAYKRGALTTDQLTKSQSELLAKQPIIKKGIDEQKKALEDEEKATKTASEAHWKYIESMDASTKKTGEEATALNETTARMGLSKVAVAELDRAKLELLATESERAAIRTMDKNGDEVEYNALMKQAEAYRTLGKAKVDNATTAKDVDDFRGLWDSVDKAAESTFTNILSGGQNTFTKLTDTLKSTLLAALYQMTIKKWVFNITAGLSGASAAATDAVGSGLSGAAGSGLSGAAGSAGGSMLGSAVAGVGAFGTGASYGMTSLFANGLGGTLSAGSSMIGAGSTMAGIGTIAGALAPIALGIAVLSKAMAYTVEAKGGALVANVGSGGVTGDVAHRSDFQQTGGLFGGGVTNNSSWDKADSGTSSYLNSAVQNVTAANAAYATALGLSASSMDGFTKQLDINISGMDSAAAKTAIDSAALAFGNEQVAAAYGGVISKFALVGESAGQTIQRLATLTVAMDTLNSFGGAFSKIAEGGFNATQSMVELAGGLDKLIAKSQAFVQSYYSDSEQAGIAASGVMAALSAAGISAEVISGLSNKADFRTLVESIDVTTATGQSQLNALLDIAPQFAGISSALEKQGGSLDGLAGLAPEIAALQPVLTQGASDQQTATATAANATQTAISTVTTAVTAGSDSVVTAINALGATVQTMANNTAASTAALQGRQNQPMLVQVVSP